MKSFIFEIIIGIRWDRTNVLRIFIKKRVLPFSASTWKELRCHHSCPYNKKKIEKLKTNDFSWSHQRIKVSEKITFSNLQRSICLESHSESCLLEAEATKVIKSSILHNTSFFQQKATRHVRKIGKINKSKGWFFKWINTINTPLVGITKIKKNNPQQS